MTQPTSELASFVIVIATPSSTFRSSLATALGFDFVANRTNVIFGWVIMFELHTLLTLQAFTIFAFCPMVFGTRIT
jgi:hypothetical protein